MCLYFGKKMWSYVTGPLAVTKHACLEWVIVIAKKVLDGQILTL